MIVTFTLPLTPWVWQNENKSEPFTDIYLISWWVSFHLCAVGKQKHGLVLTYCFGFCHRISADYILETCLKGYSSSSGFYDVGVVTREQIKNRLVKNEAAEAEMFWLLVPIRVKLQNAGSSSMFPIMLLDSIFLLDPPCLENCLSNSTGPVCNSFIFYKTPNPDCLNDIMIFSDLKLPTEDIIRLFYRMSSRLPMGPQSRLICA